MMKRSMLALSVMVGSLSLVPETVSACSCAQIPADGARVATVVGKGSRSIVTALNIGFRNTATQIDASNQFLSRTLGIYLNEFAEKVGKQILAQPEVAQGVEQRLNAASPSRHATNECSYMDRASDSAVADVVFGAQQASLSASVIDYNEIPSQYPEGVNASVAFAAQTNRLLKENPEVKTAPVAFVSAADKEGAMTPEEVQNTSRALNLSMNPSPPARIQNPVSPKQIKANVDVDLYNLRSSIPQGIAQDLLAYEAPLLEVNEDSWYADILKRMSPDRYDEFVSGGKKISKTDLLRHMATHRVKDSATTAMTAAKEIQGLQKDLALVKADSLVMDYELWRMDRYETLLMTQLVASQVRQERVNE